jgi:hypothetical protein
MSPSQVVSSETLLASNEFLTYLKNWDTNVFKIRLKVFVQSIQMFDEKCVCVCVCVYIYIYIYISLFLFHCWDDTFQK